MKRILFITFFLFFFTIFCKAQVVAGRMNEVFLKTDLASGLLDPWEITYGPDDSLWITESKGYKLYKIHPNGGAKRTILDISLKSKWLGTTPASDSIFNIQFDNTVNTPQGGFAGMAIHPDFNAATPKKYVYVSYVRSYVSTASNNAGVFYINRIVRFNYNTISGKLDNPVSICDTLPGSSDHNSQRMIIAPVNGVNYLFYAAGDMGAGQFGNTGRPNKAQNVQAYEGKILRFNLEPDGDVGTLDKWIPNDNPNNNVAPVIGQSAVWSTGIRNNQGFAYDSVKNILYGSSHGPFSDDEINIIQPSKNYGHPLVIGYNDGNYDGSRAATATYSGTSTSLPLIVSEAANAIAIGSSYKDPLYSAYAAPKATINNLYTTNPSNGSWPSEAWSGISFYRGSMIPGWKNSLLMSSLKWGRVLRLSLNAMGDGVVPINGQDTVSYFGSQNRFRDIALNPDGKTMYVVMDNSTTTSGPSSANPVVPSCKGCVQKYTFLGYNTVAGTSGIPSAILIATGKPNICENANTVTINGANNNNNLWVPITDTNSNVIAEINANGNNLGTITTSLYVNGSGTVRENSATHVLYGDRNITITPQTQPSTNVSIRLYLTTSEYSSLKNSLNSLLQPSGIAAISDINIFKNSDACSAALSATPTKFASTFSGAQGSSGYYVQTDIPSFSTFYFANRLSVLPVNLLTFNGSLIKDAVQLDWSTINEINTKVFIVERSKDGRHFDSIGYVAAKSVSGKQNYQYEDGNVASMNAGVLYYRIKMVDADRNYNYSNQISIYLPVLTGKISVRPNPVTDVAAVQIISGTSEKVNWKLIDNTGKVVAENDLQLHKGENNLQINMQAMPFGMYYLKVSGASILQTIKIQKQ